ncbi:hypothetical protein ASG73_04890 [Janibacter sp. Soil728]|nr:hypothetical protein ASG73_04890 [Janibacter sp. Soil728]
MTTAAWPGRTRSAYVARAAEYISLLGSVGQMNPLDACLLGEWSDTLVGPVLDAGSGPGHWTDFLRSRGCVAHGVDAVPQFVESARERFPLTSFEVGDLLELPFVDARFGGVLAWYSVIHMNPEESASALAEFARVTTDDGHLLMGAFLGPDGHPFDHAVTTAYCRSEQGLTTQIEAAGFHVLSTHTRTSREHRPHLAVIARKRPPGQKVT